VSARVVAVQALDPFGEGGENDIDAALTIDGDPGTFWSTESYDAPLPLIKSGVGLAFTLIGTPSSIQILGLSPSTRLDLRWAPTPDFNTSEVIAGATSSQGPLLVMVRTDSRGTDPLADGSPQMREAGQESRSTIHP
jgi:putative peptidoglycan lipid II flippase